MAKIDIRTPEGEEQITEIEWSDCHKELKIDYTDNTVMVNADWVDLCEIRNLMKALQKAVDLLPEP